MSDPLRIFIGLDERQPLAYTVAHTSIAKHASRPVAITPLMLRTLPIVRHGLTSFTFSRYLVPWLCDYRGHALFVDGDVLCRGDIAELPWESDADVCVVPHSTVQKSGETVNLQFERASVMLFNCGRCTILTPEYVQNGKPQALSWAKTVGALPKEWNYLVGYDSGGDAKLAHFTMGIPCFAETAKDEFAVEWTAMAREACRTCAWDDLMGDSVHAKWKRKPAVTPFLALQGMQ